MLSPKLSARYAKSLIDLSKSLSKEDEVISDMKLIQETINNSSELRSLLKSPIVPSDKKIAVLNAIFSTRISSVTTKFLELLVVKGREAQLKEIVANYITQYNKTNNIVNATLITAVEVDNSTVEKIKAIITSDDSVKEVILKTKVDADIVGGFVLQYDDKRLDNSALRKLQIIKNNIQDKSFISNL